MSFLKSMVNFTKHHSNQLGLSQIRQRAKATTDFQRTILGASLAFIAVGSIAFLGLQKITAPTAPSPTKATSQSASIMQPQDTALQIAMALEILRERDAAKRAQQAKAPQLASTVPASLPETPTLVSSTPRTPSVSIEPEDASAQVTTINSDPASAPCYAEVLKVAKQSTIFFKIGSAQFDSDDTPSLRKLGLLIADCPQAIIHVTGHSDTSGSDLANLNLSWQRADNAVSALSALGLNTDRFEPMGFGARSPLSQGGASDSEQNRRVEFVVLRAR